MDEMTPQQMIDKGIETGDLELIKKGRELEKNSVAVKKRGGRKKGSKNKPKVTTTTKPNVKVKVPKFKSDAEHLAYIREMERKRIDDLVNGRAGPINQPVNYFVDYDKSFSDDTKFDKQTRKIKQHKEPRREPVNYVSVACPRCGKTVQITENESALYNFNANMDVNSGTLSNDKPLFSCGQCR